MELLRTTDNMFKVQSESGSIIVTGSDLLFM